MMVLRTLLENELSQNKALKAEHGLSFLAEVNDKKILFDCSAGTAAWDNSIKMNVNLKDVDYVVLSHSHYDHAGGYPDILSKGIGAPLVTGPHFFEEKYAREEGKYVYLGCGFSQQLLEQNAIRHIVCEEALELFPGCFAVGGFERKYDFEKPPERFVRQTEGGMIVDDFPDEICLVIESQKGLVVIVGCSHPGILNMIRTVKERFAKPIYAVFGGSHLVEADEGRLRETTKILNNAGVGIVGFNHCTGQTAECHLSEGCQELAFSHLKSGDCIFLD